MSTVLSPAMSFVIRIISRRVVIVQCFSIRLTDLPVKSAFSFSSRPSLGQFAVSSCKFFEAWLDGRKTACICPSIERVEPPFQALDLR